jgi:glyoxylase-like metal-dependent hydrolase (beta-lactamase superfamily II)
MQNPKSQVGIFSEVHTPIPIGKKDLFFVQGFGNVGLIDTDEGALLFDIGARQMSRILFERIRSVTPKPIRYIVYSHGHFDHCFGYALFADEWTRKGRDPPCVIAHENVVNRFEKYRVMASHQAWINSQQFEAIIPAGLGQVVSARETLDPTILVHGWETYKFTFGNYDLELHPAWGETDDAMWMYVPKRATVFAGDLFLWSFPNVGNPLKVQRYPKQWAQALRQIIELEPEFLAPGHGELIEGRENVRNALSITAEALEFVHDGVVRRLNEGKWFEQIFSEMMDIYPDKFRESPYLQPIYGCYQFAIHASYRLYHGWYSSGNPSDLFPARTSSIAHEILQITGKGAEKNYIARAEQLATEGNSQMALHMLDIVINGGDESKTEAIQEASSMKVRLLKQIAEKEPSFIARNIYLSAAKILQKELNERIIDNGSDLD